MLFGRRAAPSTSADSSAEAEAQAMAAERQRWAEERKMLLADCTAVRAEAGEHERTLAGWSALVRDLLFYGVIHGRRKQATQRLAETLAASCSEVEGVTEVEVSELRLPSLADFAPSMALAKYAGPELSEWQLRWEPPSEQGGFSIKLSGRKFGVSFSLVVAVAALRVNGLLVCRSTPETETPALSIGFKTLPSVSFSVSLAGKALSLGEPTLRSWLQRQVEKALVGHCVLPQTVEVPLFGAQAGGPAATPATATPSSAAASPADPDSTYADEGDASLRTLLNLRSDSYAGPTWQLDEALAQLIGVPRAELASRAPMLESAGARAEPTEWATALVIAMLQLRYHDRANAWSALVETRRSGLPRDLMRAAMEAVCEVAR